MAGAGKAAAGNLDDILDRALDDFDEEEDVRHAALIAEAARKAAGGGAASGSGAGAGAGAGASTSGAATSSGDVARAAAAASAATSSGDAADADGPDDLSDMMSKLMGDMNQPQFQATLDATMRELSGGATMRELSGGATTSGTASVLNPFAGLPQGVGALPREQTDRTVAETLNLLAGASRDQEGVDPATAEAMGEEVMKKMMGQFEAMGEKEDFQSVIDNMMKQLLSKDIMYMPMKQICDKFPEWLADNESKLSTEDYERFGRQYQYFQQLVAVYETEPDNFPRLMELMQDMQETGQPPAELIKELAPGLQFTEDGMPMMPNMGAGVPTIGGMPGACTVM